jgi:hypothetical protein
MIDIFFSNRKHLFRFPKKRIVTGSVILLVTGIGIYALVFTHAATPYATVEAENGTLSSNASLAIGSGASSGKYVSFGTPEATASSKGIGLSVPTFPTLSQSEQIAWLKDFQSLGITWIRFDIYWSNVQPTNASSYNWSMYDTAITNADAYGMHIDAIVDYSTPWASESTCSTSEFCQPANAQTYATYAAAIAQRYGSKIASEEIWNEPNIVNFWLPAPNAAFYTSMLKDSYTAIKAVDPSMLVISSGLSPAGDDGTNIAPITFVQDMYNNGAHGAFDALGDHPYSYPALPNYDISWNAWSQMNQTSPSIRSIMTANGDVSKPIWITEVGAPTGGPGTQATCTSGTNFNGGAYYDDQCLQAENITQVVQNEQSLSWVGPAFIYSYQDLGTDESTVENFFGILTSNGTQKQSYSALQQAIAANPN